MIKTAKINDLGECDDVSLALGDIRFIYYNKTVYEMIGGYAGKLHTHDTIITHFELPPDKCIRLEVLKDRAGTAFGIEHLGFSCLYNTGLSHDYPVPKKQDLDIIENYVKREIEFSERTIEDFNAPVKTQSEIEAELEYIKDCEKHFKRLKRRQFKLVNDDFYDTVAEDLREMEYTFLCQVGRAETVKDLNTNIRFDWIDEAFNNVRKKLTEAKKQWERENNEKW